MKIKKVVLGACATLGLAVGVAVATETVIINNMQWSCQNSCVISFSGGGYSVSDSGGGWFRFDGYVTSDGPIDA